MRWFTGQLLGLVLFAQLLCPVSLCFGAPRAHHSCCEPDSKTSCPRKMEQPCPYLTLQTGKVETKTDTVPPQLSVTVIHRADTRAEFLPQSSAAGYQTDRSRLYLTNHNLLI